ncbi:MAG: hypothetical protein N0E44_18990 [Candidatus Thiodiazotropha lotti]|nr:hypothetical protein [Candidatus Thiodiazotropha lotti]MCW4221972.1 hypothetical protein [Candidatus Thiodiazotropha lotti]
MKHARSDYNRIQDPDRKIPDDEPVFLLRAQDKYAAEVVRFYATVICQDPDATDEALNISATAFSWADRMDGWVKKKSPDMV